MLVPGANTTASKRHIKCRLFAMDHLSKKLKSESLLGQNPKMQRDEMECSVSLHFSAMCVLGQKRTAMRCLVALFYGVKSN